MKVAILTFHRAHNYGAVLQCYALYRALSEKGISCDVLDYSPDYFYKMYNILPYKHSLKTSIGTYVCHILLRSMLEERVENFNRFISEYISLSAKTYNCEEDLTSIPYDAIIVGSDQVWNNKTALFDPVFFLSTKAFEVKRKYSYAASIGMDKIPPDLTAEYKNRLQGYRMISVREESGVSILKDLLHITPVVSCDPTLLLNTAMWKQIAGEKPLVEGDYIFLYYVKQPSAIRAYAKALSEKMKCKVICCSCMFSGGALKKYEFLSGKADRRDGFVTMNSISPDQFLNLILHAKFMLCSSFHATVFSIIFHKQFLSQTVWEGGKTNDRVKNLLAFSGLLDRIINNSSANITDSIDWQSVDQNIENMRENGLKYLEDISLDLNKA